MNCPISSCLYLKANGEVPCWCGIGENKILYHADEHTDFVNTVLLGDNYKTVSKYLHRNKVPWPVLCKMCVFLDKNSNFRNKIVEDRHIDCIQLEPSFLCQLDCLSCIPPKKYRKKFKAPPYNMTFTILKKMIDDLYTSDFSVGLFDFQGRGEPLMNKDIWKMIRYVKKQFPASNIELTTNGNFDYEEKSINAGLTKLIISADGCFQESYEKYRKGGNINTVLTFIENCTAAKRNNGSNTKIIWKYILFDHNESDEELIETQKKADKFNVDELNFHVTPLVHKCKISKYFNDKINKPLCIN